VTFAAIGRAYTVTIATEIGHYNVESLGQRFGDLVPACERFRVAV
jgi:hypothetical protein